MSTPTQCPACAAVGRHLTTCPGPEATGLWPCEPGKRWFCEGCSMTGDGGAVEVGGRPVCVGCAAHAAIEGDV